jgi:predicted nucleic acid-binding protein
MPVVSDTSPILNLAIINQLDLLQQQFTEVLIPPAVLAELMPETKFPEAETIQQALEAGWLQAVDELRIAQTITWRAVTRSLGTSSQIEVCEKVNL